MSDSKVVNVANEKLSLTFSYQTHSHCNSYFYKSLVLKKMVTVTLNVGGLQKLMEIGGLE